VPLDKRDHQDKSVSPVSRDLRVPPVKREKKVLLVHLVLAEHQERMVKLDPSELLDLQVKLEKEENTVNQDPQDSKVFLVYPEPLVKLERLANLGSPVKLDPLVQLDQEVNVDSLVKLDLLDHKVLPVQEVTLVSQVLTDKRDKPETMDLQENLVHKVCKVFQELVVHLVSLVARVTVVTLVFPELRVNLVKKV